jgi:hypothetical protein
MELGDVVMESSPDHARSTCTSWVTGTGIKERIEIKSAKKKVVVERDRVRIEKRDNFLL